jgi:class 3 adenylate cyclase/tetratricopeptide (TPR) repeat protein
VETPLQRFIPRELLARLQTAQASSAMQGERRIVTMLFCDVKGSTAAAGQLDPEEWAEIINGAFEQMITPVYRYEGTVARLMGDGLLAFFGAPIAHEDDPQRAVLAGLDILRAVQGYRVEVKQRWGINFDVRVGVNTGLVVVGAVGSDLRMEYTALGDAINLAARMEQTAAPGTIQIAEPTYKLVAPLFEMESLEGVEIKGKAERVRAYRVVGPKAQPGRLRGIEGLHAPLIGRDREQTALWTAIDALRAGRGGVVSVMGEAGLGKSRLIAEVRDAVIADPTVNLQWVEGRSLSYQTATPYAIFGDLFTNCFNLRLQPDDVTRYRRLQESIDHLLPGLGEATAPFMATLLGMHLPPTEMERVKYLEPPQLRGLIFHHSAALIERLTKQAPLVMVLDDLHWIDPTSLDLLESLLPLTNRAPLLIIAAFRLRTQEISWRFHERAQSDYADHYTPIALQPLGEDEARTLVANLLHVEDLPEHVRRLILEKSEGNPFFVEEVIRSLLDGGLVVRDNDRWRATRAINDIAVPDTLVGVITARLDRLSDDSRQIVQAASVLGRHFAFDTVADLFGPANGQLEAGLVDLLRRQLIRERDAAPTRSYTFKHALTQEAAYNTILLSKRRDLHRRSAESLLRRTPEQDDEIARHFLEARQPARAMPHLVNAGERAAKNYASSEALGFFVKALELQATVEELTPVRRAYEGLGGVYTLTNQPLKAVETYQAMLTLAEERGDASMQISALNKLAGVFALNMGQFAEAEAHLARAAHLIQAHQDLGGEAEAALIRCQMCTAQGDFKGVIQHMGNMAAIGQAIGSKEYMAMGLEHVAFSLLLLTRFDEAWETGQQAVEIAREVGDRLHECSALTTTIPYCLIRQGRLDEGAAILRDGLEIAHRIGALYPIIYGNWLMGELHRWRGDFEAALESHKRSLDAALPYESFMPFLVVQPLGALGSTYLEMSPTFFDAISELHRHALQLLESPMATMGGGTAWSDLGWCAMALGDAAIAEQSFEKGLNYPSMFMLLEKARYLAGSALLASQQGSHDEALHLAKEACAYVEERAMRHLFPLVRLTSGRVLAANGDHDAALAQFALSEKWAAELTLRPILWQAQAHAARSLQALENPAQAEAKRKDARAVIDEIAKGFTNEELRTAFRTNALGRV